MKTLKFITSLLLICCFFQSFSQEENNNSIPLNNIFEIENNENDGSVQESVNVTWTDTDGTKLTVHTYATCEEAWDSLDNPDEDGWYIHSCETCVEGVRFVWKKPLCNIEQNNNPVDD